MARVNVKQIAIEHGEKAVLGLAVVFGLWVLWQADWTPYRGTAEEIKRKVETGRDNLASNPWPSEEQAKYRISNAQAPANVAYQRLLSPIDSAPAALPGEMNVDFFRTNDPVRDPVLLALRSPLAISGRAFLDQVPDAVAAAPAETPAPAGTPSAAKPVDASIPDEFLQGTTGRAPPPGGVAGPDPNSAAGGYSAATDPNEIAFNLESERRAQEMEMMDALRSQLGDDFENRQQVGSSFDKMNLVQGPTLKAKGYSFVAVRAVFPLREQIEKYQAAIHRPFQSAANAFDIRDFVLERQMKLPGEDQWSAWSPVDMEIANDILTKANGFQVDLVDSTITNPVITMPLPARVTGEWRETATHPAIKDFELSDAAMDQEYEYQKLAFLEAARRQQNTAPPPARPRNGFVGMTVDTRDAIRNLAGAQSVFSIGTGTNNTDLDGLIKDLAKYSGTGEDKKQEELIRQWLKKQFDARGELLLFRYLDFGVQPGRTYKYRVRLILSNPNFGMSQAAAGGEQHVVEGEIRETPWSDETAPVTVEPETQYYVRSNSESSSRVFPSAWFDVFEWNTDKGSTVNANLEVAMGQHMGGDVPKMKVIDAAKSTMEETKYQFKSPDFLVDVASSIVIDKAFHAEGIDGLPGVKVTNVSNDKLTIPAQVLVRTGDGVLRYLSPPAQQQDYDRRKYVMSLEDKHFEAIKNAATAVSRLLDNPDDLNGSSRGSRRRLNRLGSGRRGAASSISVPGRGR